MRPVRVALVGAGMMGANHARVVAAEPTAELACVVDVDPERARRLAADYDAAWNTDLGAALDADAVIVATPAETHIRVASTVIAGGRPLLVEKPVALDADSVAMLVAMSRRSGVPLMGGFVERFNPVIVAAREHLAVHGPVRHFVAVRHSPPSPRVATGVVHDLLIHDLDLMLHLVGSADPRRVTGAVWRPHPDAPEEIADCTVVLSDEALGTASASRVDQRKVREVRIVTPTVLMELDLLRRTMTLYRHVTHGATLDRVGYQAETVIDIPFIRQEGEPLALQLRSFLALVRGDADPEPVRSSLAAPHRLAHDLVAAALAGVA